MCDICDGMSVAESMAKTRDLIDRYGFTMVSVESRPPWAYTIGLTAGFDHPELVIAGLHPSPASTVLSDVAQRVMAGERFDAESLPIEIDDIPVRFGEVHPRQWVLGRFDGWLRYYQWLGNKSRRVAALQILWPNDDGVYPPDPDFCHRHTNCQPLLSLAPTHNVNRSPKRKGRRRSKR